ncbi:MAG: family 10 glycosylhydrolase [Candidatus Hinthialibacter antarcticus]|nr:family 10 glycosylhydrolase [Candidatus Hinthialibacter antarcticus]
MKLQTICLITFVVIVSSLQADADSRRAIWVTRWDFKTAADIRVIIENAKALNASDVLFQVRGNATVFYPSKLEPWAWELTSDDARSTGKDPGWDPLRTAIDAAHASGLRLHAWVNVFPGWRGGDAPPKSARQLWTTHRSWFMVDHHGSFMWPTKAFYSFLSPGIPEVQKHTAAVMKEMVELYPDLDGIHMDYIRYPGNKELGAYRNFSFDKTSVARFKQQYKRSPRHDSDEWSRFKRDQVGDSLQLIRKQTKAVNADIELSATFFADINKATEEKGQDPSLWLQNEWIDWAVPMVYQRSAAKYQESLDALKLHLGTQWNWRMVPGLLATSISPDILQAQLKATADEKFGGAALFAYSALYKNHKPNSKASRVRTIWREEMVQELLTKSPAEAQTPTGDDES